MGRVWILSGELVLSGTGGDYLIFDSLKGAVSDYSSGNEGLSGAGFGGEGDC